MQTLSHNVIAARFDTTGSVERKLFDVVKKFNIVVTPARNHDFSLVGERKGYNI